MSEFVLLVVLTAIVVMLLVGWLLHSATRPADTSDDPDEPVVVAGPGAHMEIEVMRAKLDAMGVPAYVRNRQGPFMPGGVPPQLWGWEVLVRRRDVGTADEMLFGTGSDLHDGEGASFPVAIDGSTDGDGSD
jgi:hypothetical protein